MSQHDRIIAYMKNRGGITVLEAAKELNIFYLPRRISDLEARGIKIKRTDRKIITSSGKLLTIKVYSLQPKAEEMNPLANGLLPKPELLTKEKQMKLFS